MNESFRDNLAQATARLREMQRLQATLQQRKQQAAALVNQWNKLQRVLEKEKNDVEKLEGMSITAMFYSMLGTKENRLREERKEFLTAKLRFEECDANIDSIKRDVDQLEKELQEHRNTKQQYDSLIESKRLLLLEENDERTRQLIRYTERIAHLEADAKELQEAITAGERASNSLKRVQSALSSARTYGTWDLMGGGMLSTMAKHSEMDTAQRYAHEAQRNLRRFNSELADVGKQLQTKIELDGFTKFADYFFDGLIVDWCVQSQIDGASSSCTRTIRDVLRATHTCTHQLRSVEKELTSLVFEQNRYIEQA